MLFRSGREVVGGGADVISSAAGRTKTCPSERTASSTIASCAVSCCFFQVCVLLIFPFACAPWIGWSVLYIPIDFRFHFLPWVCEVRICVPWIGELCICVPCISDCVLSNWFGGVC